MGALRIIFRGGPFGGPPFPLLSFSILYHPIHSPTGSPFL